MRNSLPENLFHFFSTLECYEIYRKLIYHELYWEKRDEAPWFTFGPAAYLDASHEKGGNFEKYMLATENFKPLFDKTFEEEKEIILINLEKELREPVYFHSRYMPFGFHIFRSDPVFLEDNIGSIHMDKQEELLLWDGPVEQKFSLTIPICIPKAGAGLNYWVGEEKKYWMYSLGTAVLHYGNIKHQIASAKAPIDMFDERITMQLHAVKVNGTWLIHR